MKLVGDIGGTKVLLALADAAGQLQDERRLASADFADFADLVAAYLGDNTPRIDGGCLAVAGPVADDGRTAKITNLPWRIDAAALEARFGLGRLQLVNDFVGAAMGVSVLADRDRVTLQRGEPQPQGVSLVIGAGTGLGMATLVHIAGHWHVLPSEGGHAAFAPADELQLRIWSALQEEYGRVTYERVVSGPGLANIHRILSGTTADPVVIAATALAEPGSVARQAVETFLAIYGAVAGDMAMAVMARGGVYLAGGIAAKILPLMQGGAFLRAFNAKAEHAELMRRTAVYVATDPRLGLHGAAELARQGQALAAGNSGR